MKTAIEEDKKLQRLFSTFPGGKAGVGLLLLRMTLGITSLVQGVFYLFARENTANWLWFFGLAAIVIGVLLLVGFLTPVLSSIVCLGNIFVLFFPFSAVNFSIFTIIIAVSLILLGPGAFSLDARIFGRREIIIPKRATNS